MTKTRIYSDGRLLSAIMILGVCLVPVFLASQHLDQEQPDCDLKLLRSYKLKGLRRPSHRSMHICPHVTSKCCTLNDELSIYKLWNTYADYTTKRFHTFVTRSWFRLIDYHDEFKKLDRNDITVHYMAWRWIPYIHRSCDRRYITSKLSTSNPSPMQSELQIDDELPGVGPVQKHHYSYRPDYLDVVTKGAHMKKVLEIYKAALNQLFLEMAKRREASKKIADAAKADLAKDDQKMLKAEVMLANKKRIRSKNKLHIFGPKDTLSLVGAQMTSSLVKPVLKAKAKVVKTSLKGFKRMDKMMNKVKEIIKYESILASMYNMSQISDYSKLKKYVYHFVLRFRYWHKPKKKIEWNRYSPTLYKLNLSILPKCSKRILRWHRKMLQFTNLRKFMIEMHKKNRHRATVIQRRKQIINAWKKKHMNILKRSQDKHKMKADRKKLQNKLDIMQMQKDKKRKEDLEDKKLDRPQIMGMGRGFRKLKQKKGKKKNKTKLTSKGTTVKDRKLRRRRGRRGRRKSDLHRRYGMKFKPPWWLAPRPWMRPGYRRWRSKNINIQTKRKVYNYRVQNMYRIEKYQMMAKTRHCDYRCRLKKLPRNIDYNNMCILPKKYVQNKPFYFYGKFRKNRQGDWYPKHGSDRSHRRQMRRNKRRRSPFKKRRRRRRRRKLSKVTTKKKGNYKAQKNLSPPERHLSLSSSIKDVFKPISDSAYKVITKLYKSPVVEKKDKASEYKEVQLKTQEKYLSPDRKLVEKVDQMAESPVVEQDSVENGVNDGNLSLLAEKDQVSLKSGVDMDIPHQTLSLEDLEAGSTSDGIETKENRKLFFGKPKNPFANVKSPFGKPKNPFGKLRNPFGRAPRRPKPQPMVPKESKLLRNPRDRFHVKEKEITGKFSPAIDPTRVKRTIPVLLKERMELTSVPKGFFYRKLKYPLPMMGSILPRDEIITCRTFKRHLWKSFINVNKEKVRYCYRIYDSLQAFDTDQFRKGVTIMREKLKEVIHLKRGFYCSMCDYDRQSMFDHKNKLIIYSGDFCMDFMKEYKELINFQNVILVEYMDQMLQLVECYRGNGNFFDFPYRTYLEMHKRRIFFIQRCFAHRLTERLHPERRGKVEDDTFEQEGFLKHCMFICNQFNYVKFSPFIDGDLRTLNIVLMRLFQYLREMRFSPYIKSPPYQFLPPQVYSAVTDSALEKSRGYQNSLDSFIRSQYQIGQNNKISTKAMGKDNKEEKLRKMVNKLQYDLFYKKKHFDDSIDSIGFNKKLKKILFMKKIMANQPPNYIPNQIKRAKRARGDRAHAKKYKQKLRGRRGKVMGSTTSIKRRENKIMRKVKYAYEDAARDYKRHVKEMNRTQKNHEREKKRNSRELKNGKEEEKKKLELLENTEDLSLMKTYKELKDDGAYYGVDSAQPEIKISGTDQIDASSMTQIPERKLSSRRRKKSKKKRKRKRRRRRKKKGKKTKKNIIILSRKVKLKKGGYKTEKVAHKVTSWGKYRAKILSKKNKVIDRWPEMTKRQNGDFGFYPPDSEHIMQGIYQEKRKFYDLKKYKSMYFLHMHGLNPLFDAAHMRHDINPETIIRMEYDLRHPEKFNRDVILQYFGIPNETVNDFNFDITDNHYLDLARLKEMPKNPVKNKRAKLHKKRNKKKPWRKSRLHNEMMKRQHVYGKKHKNPDHFELGIHEHDPQTTADQDSEFMFYMFDHRRKYPIFRNT